MKRSILSFIVALLFSPAICFGGLSLDWGPHNAVPDSLKYVWSYGFDGDTQALSIGTNLTTVLKINSEKGHLANIVSFGPSVDSTFDKTPQQTFSVLLEIIEIIGISGGFRLDPFKHTIDQNGLFYTFGYTQKF